MPITIRFEYQARNNREDLTDVNIIIRNDTGTSVVSSTAMTHRSYGKYTYDYSATSSGWYHAQMSSDTETRTVVDSKYASVSTDATISSTVVGQYVSTLQFNEYLNMFDIVPSWAVGATPAKENISTTSLLTTTTLYLDQRNVIDGTLTVYYGATEPTATSTLTETTNYTVDYDRGIITVTASGTSLASASTVFAEYRFNTLGLRDSYLRDVLDRAQVEIDRQCNTHFADGTQASPDYQYIDEEYHTGKGQLRRIYYTNRYPIPNVRTNLGASLTTTATTITVDSTNGFATTSTLTIGGEVIDYVGKTSTTFTNAVRGVNGSSAISHANDDLVAWLTVQRSRDDEGEAVTWDTMEADVDYSIDYDSGQVKLMEPLFSPTVARTTLDIHPIKDVPKRFRISYPVGWKEIPEDIRQVNLMIAAKRLMKANVGKALVTGFADFRPDSYRVNDDEIDEILQRYRSFRGEYI